jgi:hypothetical protein
MGLYASFLSRHHILYLRDLDMFVEPPLLHRAGS